MALSPSYVHPAKSLLVCVSMKRRQQPPRVPSFVLAFLVVRFVGRPGVEIVVAQRP